MANPDPDLSGVSGVEEIENVDECSELGAKWSGTYISNLIFFACHVHICTAQGIGSGK